MVQKLDDTRVHDAVIDVIAVAPGAHDTSIRQADQLIGDSLGLHGKQVRHFRDAHFPRPYQGMKHPETGIVGQGLKDCAQFDRLLWGQKFPFLQRRFGRT